MCGLLHSACSKCFVPSLLLLGCDIFDVFSGVNKSIIELVCKTVKVPFSVNDYFSIFQSGTKFYISYEYVLDVSLLIILAIFGQGFERKKKAGSIDPKFGGTQVTDRPV